MRKLNNILVTGGSGFIGSNFIRYIFNQKDLIGPEIEFSTEISVHYHLKKLKHGLKYPLPLFVIFESKQRIHNFQIEYVINVGNHPKQINGKLFVMLKKNEIEIV